MEELGLAIEKIKQQEQNKEAKLKAQREFETSKATIERSVREAISQAKKFQLEKCELIKKTGELQSQLTIQKIRKDALAAQLLASRKELLELKAKTDQVMTETLEQRNSYNAVVQTVSDECDVWALLMKPTSNEPVSRPAKKIIENDEQALVNEQRLKAAMGRREKAVAERARLLAEPEVGEEFVRIKNALRYSLEMAANLR